MDTNTDKGIRAGIETNHLSMVAKEASQLVERLQPSVVWVEAGYGHGSGLVWDQGGLIITNDHVVSGDRARIERWDGRRLAARLVGRDPHSDLAALVPEDGAAPPSWVPAAIGDSAALRVGELIIAVGHPFGVRGTATLGIVSRAPGDLAPRGGAGRGRAPRELLQADVDLAPGNSGGPLVNAAGEVVGIASMVVGPGIALAVPSHVVSRFVAAIRTARDDRVPGAAERSERQRAA